MDPRKQRAMIVTGASIAAVALAVAVVALIGALGGDTPGDAASDEVVELTDPLEQPPPVTGDGSFTSISFATFSGATVDIGSFRGTPVVVNFWSSTCAPCIEEMPDFEAVHQRRDDVAFIGMNTSDRHSEAVVFAERTGVTYQLGRDPDGEIFRAAGAVALPTTLFLDESGEVVDSHTGALDRDELSTRIDELFGA